MPHAMPIEVTVGDVRWEDWDRRLLERRLARLELALRRYGLADDARLDVHVQPFGDRDLRAEAHLSLAGETLHTDHTAADMPGLVRGLVDGLRQEFHRYRLKVDPRLRARAVRRRERRSSRPQAYAFRRLPEPLQAQVVERLLPALQRAASHEVTLHQAQGDLEPGDVDPMEVVGDVLRDELEQQEQHHSVAALAARLEERVVQRVHQLAQEYEEHRDTAALQLDTDVPESPEELEGVDLGQDLLDFWPIDEDLKLEDLFIDATSVDPETVVAEREGQEILVQGLFRLPEEMRRVFSAVLIDGWSREEVAGARGLSVSDLDGLVDEAAHRLARTLTGAPAYSTARVFELYTALGEQLHRNPVRLHSA